MSLQKGAIIGLDLTNPLASLIVFQYNPETMTRTLAVQSMAVSTKTQSEGLRLAAPPSENISVEIELDATDQLEKGDGLTQSLGIHPVLASLEMLLYPKALGMILNNVLIAGGMVPFIPPGAPLVLFIWGVKRVLPVRISGMTITEDFFDGSLNPLRAKVRLDMRVLSYHDLGLISVGGALFLAHQLLKEGMATIQGVGTIAGTASSAATGAISAGASFGGSISL
jgi:hypothetical protein